MLTMQKFLHGSKHSRHCPEPLYQGK